MIVPRRLVDLNRSVELRISHVFRKTAATILDEAGLSARMVADQLGHARPSLTQDVYLGRKAVGRDAADALESALDTESG